jgi:hypothetical protein
VSANHGTFGLHEHSYHVAVDAFGGTSHGCVQFREQSRCVWLRRDSVRERAPEACLIASRGLACYSPGF